MIPIYKIRTADDWRFKKRVHQSTAISKDWWTFGVLSRTHFEDAEHLLTTYGDNYQPGQSDQAPDICEAGNSIWGFSEECWDWLPDLINAGCRVAHNVRVESGKKQFKLVYPAVILDLLDHGRSDVSWNGGTISAVRNAHLFDWDGIPPLMFKVLLHNKEEYKGVLQAPYHDTFVSPVFKREVERRELSGVEFSERPRTQRPLNEPEPSSIFVYKP